jgi:hypothetical protein
VNCLVDSGETFCTAISCFVNGIGANATTGDGVSSAQRLRPQPFARHNINAP